MHWMYRDAVPAGTSAISLMLTGATLPDDVQGTPPPKDTPEFTILVMLGSAEARSSTLTNFSRQVTNWRVLGFADPRIPWDSN